MKLVAKNVYLFRMITVAGEDREFIMSEVGMVPGVNRALFDLAILTAEAMFQQSIVGVTEIRYLGKEMIDTLEPPPKTIGPAITREDMYSGTMRAGGTGGGM